MASSTSSFHDIKNGPDTLKLLSAFAFGEEIEFEVDGQKIPFVIKSITRNSEGNFELRFKNNNALVFYKTAKKSGVIQVFIPE